MNTKVKWRLAAFVLAIGLMLSLTIWTAQESWNRIDLMRGRLTATRSQSFMIADHFQQKILNLNNLLLRYQIRQGSTEWEQFLTAVNSLQQWIQQQTPSWNTPEEQEILRQLVARYTFYVDDAKKLEHQFEFGTNSKISLADFAPFEMQSEQLLSLAYRLAGAHRISMNQFVDDSNASLVHLRAMLLGSLFLLVVFGAGLAWVVYQQMIAPLQLKVIESRDLAARQEKLASLGMLAAGVAQEIRNPLTAMKARLFALRRLIEPDAPEQDDLGVIDKEINRLERIVTEFLQFARPAEPVMETVDAARPLSEVHTLMTPQLEKHAIRLVLEKSDPILVSLDMHQIQQVLINLVQNAADSIGRNGVITLRVRGDTKRLNGHLTGVSILEVSDTGNGIPPEVQKRLFDPFFTTKEGGTGLGLSIAARIVEKHGGLLQYVSELNSGTTFGIVLPATKPHELHGKNPVG